MESWGPFAEGKNGIDWFAPIVADAEAGFGGSLNAFELMKNMIVSGAPVSSERFKGTKLIDVRCLG